MRTRVMRYLAPVGAAFLFQVGCGGSGTDQPVPGKPPGVQIDQAVARRENPGSSGLDGSQPAGKSSRRTSSQRPGASPWDSHVGPVEGVDVKLTKPSDGTKEDPGAGIDVEAVVTGLASAGDSPGLMLILSRNNTQYDSNWMKIDSEVKAPTGEIHYKGRIPVKREYEPGRYQLRAVLSRSVKAEAPLPSDESGFHSILVASKPREFIVNAPNPPAGRPR